jgi:hypothetical protein
MNNLMQGLDKTGQAALSSTAQKKTLAGKAAAPDKSATAATADPVSLSPAQKKTSSARTSGASHTNARDEDNQSAIDNLVAAPETTGSRGGGVRVTRLDNAATATTRPSVMREEQILLAQVQEQLMISGLFPGPADGVMNAMTADAIRSYQARNGMPATGIPTGELLAHMLR